MLTIQHLKSLLSYDPAAGEFVWLVDRGNNRVKGKRAGTINSDGYLVIEIDGVAHKGHRLAIFMMTGAWPTEVDHDDRDRSNNRWANLKAVTHKQNMENLGIHPKNKSGVRGVYWNRDIGKWHAQIGHHRKKLHIGFFDDLECARVARANVEAALFTNSGSAP